MKMNFKQKMKDEVSLVDKTGQVGCCQEWKALSTTVGHRELVGARRTKYEYNYDHAQGNNLSTIRD